MGMVGAESGCVPKVVSLRRMRVRDSDFVERMRIRWMVGNRLLLLDKYLHEKGRMKVRFVRVSAITVGCVSTFIKNHSDFMTY
jgi:hypothetical protein